MGFKISFSAFVSDEDISFIALFLGAFIYLHHLAFGSIYIDYYTLRETLRGSCHPPLPFTFIFVGISLNLLITSSSAPLRFSLEAGLAVCAVCGGFASSCVLVAVPDIVKLLRAACPVADDLSLAVEQSKAL